MPEPTSPIPQCWKRWCATSWQRWPRTCAPRGGHGWRPCRIWPTRNGRRSRTPRAIVASRPPVRPAASPRWKPASKRSTANWKKPATPRTKPKPRSWNSGAIRWSGNCKTRRTPYRATPRSARGGRCHRHHRPQRRSRHSSRLLREAEAKALRTLEKLRRGFDSTEGESANDEHEDADAPKAASLADGSGWMPAIFKAAGPQDAAQEEGSEQDATEDAEAMADEPAEALAA